MWCHSQFPSSHLKKRIVTSHYVGNRSYQSKEGPLVAVCQSRLVNPRMYYVVLTVTSSGCLKLSINENYHKVHVQLTMLLICLTCMFQETMIEHIPKLMSAIRMIYSISSHYNTAERMTSLFVKVTNQMISTCKNYIMFDVTKIWDHSR